ncbi:hypothetical protein UF75_2627 [Desulfosporosinus sp. I2]|uniref:hypothetical protein n=1 Tax=Desulfosporosinus sp. I2 TaxID=1617025 RepID=UPI00061EBD09|nr:hypothetical protein [Desulfosporosinus sp. I2]KJR47013.1 hypothetical protein UF75_2627 [Desulfosporosinus sp. I2]
MDIIPLGLLLLGVISLLIGWRWQNPRNEENRIALKGLAYLRNEIFRVQEQVHILENEIQKTKQTNIEETQIVLDHKDLDIKENDQKEAVPNKLAYQGETKILESRQIASKELVHEGIEPKEIRPVKVELKKSELREIEHIQSAKLYSITPQEQRENRENREQKENRENREQKENRDIARVRVFDEKLKSMSQASNSAPRSERISSKFTEILELAAHGQRIPEIAQHLFISQDAVRMVLSMQSKGGTR